MNDPDRPNLAIRVDTYLSWAVSYIQITQRELRDLGNNLGAAMPGTGMPDVVNGCISQMEALRGLIIVAQDDARRAREQARS